MKLQRLLFAALACYLLAASCASAGTYPSQPIKLVVPLGAGGSVDLMARSIAAELGARLGQPVVVENKPGGGTVIGAAYVAQATPDGYTLLAAPSGTFTIEAALHKELSYDPMKDFVPVAHYVDLPTGLVVNASLPVNSVADLIAYIKARPGKISYAASTVGGVYHLTGEIFKREAGVSMTPVFYRDGGPAALNDVLSGVLPLGFSDIGVARSLLATNKIRVLGVTSAASSPVLPNVPPIAATLPGFNVVSWHMIAAPAGVPPAIVARLQNELKAILDEPQQKERMRTLGLIPVDAPTPPVPQLKEFLANEIARWGKVVQQAGLAGSL